MSVIGRIPPPERHLLFVRCPRCRARIWHQLFTVTLAYETHYAGHIVDDLEHVRASR